MEAVIKTVINLVWKFVFSFKGLSVGLSGLVVYAITHPEKSERWASWIYKSLKWTGHRMKSRWIASDIQARIDSFAKAIKRPHGSFQRSIGVTIPPARVSDCPWAPREQPDQSSDLLPRSDVIT